MWATINNDKRAVFTIAGILMLVCCAAHLQIVETQTRRGESSFACDPFGYLRQARLFSENGTLGGLDTRLDGAIHQTLLEIGRTSDFPLRKWRGAIVPHCHHFKAATGQTIIQYPPGTGYLLSFFPDGTQSRALKTVSATLIALASFGLLAVVASSSGALLIAGASLLSLWTLDKAGGWSVAPSMVMALLIAGFGIAFLASKSSGRRILLAAVTGLALGLAVNLRIANVLLVAGYATVMLTEIVRHRNGSVLICAAVGALAIILGLIPTLAANHINAGSIFSTTYASNDASPPNFTWDVIAKNIVYYTSHHRTAALTIVAMAVAGVSLLWSRSFRPDVREQVVLLISVNIVVSFAFFLTHTVSIAYYLVPVTMWTVWTAVFAWNMPQSADASFVSPFRLALAGIVAAVSIVAAATMDLRQNDRFLRAETSVEISGPVMIWGDLSPGLFIHHLGLHAGKVASFRSTAVRQHFISELHDRNIDQLVVIDGRTMRRMRPTLSKHNTLTKIGLAFGFPVYRLTPGTSGEQTLGNAAAD